MSSRSQPSIVPKIPPSFSFGSYTLDLNRGALLRGSDEVKLRPKSYETLKYLVVNGGRLIPKAELIAALWPDTVSVSDDSVMHCIRDVRRALGDEGQELVRTVPGRGYMFVVPAQPPPPVQTVPATEKKAEPTAPTFITVDPLAAVVRSLAVLPFRPLSGRVNEESLALGLAIADALITAIAASREILVRATSAVRKYVDSETDTVEAARQLQVEAIVEGHFQRVGERLRVSVQLLCATDGRHMLAEHCEGVLPDIFSLQDHLAEILRRALNLKGPEPTIPMRSQSTRPECYSQYAIGRFHFLKASPDATPKAVAAFRAAITADPDFAPAHAQLAFALSQTADFFLTSYPKVCGPMSAAAERAMAMDSSLPEAVAAHGLVQQRCNWQWQEAAGSFDRALKLRPASAEIYVYAARLLDTLGRSEEAAALCGAALNLDPASSFAHLWLSFSHWFQRRYHESARWAQKALDMNPHNPIAMGRLIEAQYMFGNYKAWAAMLKKMLPFWGLNAVESEFEDALREGGREGLLRCYLGLTRGELHGNQAWWVAFYHSEVGDLDSAFACLEQACSDRASMLGYLKVDPRWDRIRRDSRFEDLVRRVGLP